MDDYKDPALTCQLDPLVLELLQPIGSLNTVSRGKLLEKARRIRLGTGQGLSAKDWSWSLLYLLDGALERQCLGRGAEILESGRPGVDQPIFPEGAPRQSQVTALEPSEILAFDRRLFELLLEQEQQQGEAEFLDTEGIESYLFGEITKDFHTGRLDLHGVPEVAQRILKLSEQPDIVQGGLSDLVALDPTLAARVVREGGRGLNHGGIKAAVAELGEAKVRALIRTYASEAGCHAHSTVVRKLMRKAYHHSVQVGAYSYVLASAVKGLNPDHALLCGLLHDIGMFPLLCTSDKHRREIGNAEDLTAVVWRLHGMISGLVLGNWGFGNDFATMAEEADDWNRNGKSRSPDYTDVVLVAQLHSFIGTERVKGLPQFANLPAFRKIADQESGPRFSLWLLQKTNPRLLAISRMLEGLI